MTKKYHVDDVCKQMGLEEINFVNYDDVVYCFNDSLKDKQARELLDYTQLQKMRSIGTREIKIQSGTTIKNSIEYFIKKEQNLTKNKKLRTNEHTNQIDISDLEKILNLREEKIKTKRREEQKEREEQAAKDIKVRKLNYDPLDYSISGGRLH